MINSMRICVILLCLALPSLSFAHVVSFDTIDVSAHQRVFKCADICRLRLCNNLQDRPRIVVRSPGSPNLFRGNGMPMGGAICKENSQQLVDVVSGEALVSPVKGSVPKVRISKYAPPGLSPAFPKGYLRVEEVLRRENRIVRGRSAGNQNDYANMLCVRLPIKKYRVLNRDGTTGSVVTTRDAKDCVAFKGTGSKLQFHLQWNTTDDLDIFLREPSTPRCVLSRFNLNCPSGGRLNRDNGDGSRCRAIEPISIREVVTYPLNSAVQSGKYVLRIQHLRNCGMGPTSYKVIVVVDGNVVRTRTGVTNNFGSDFVATFNFNIRL